MLRCAVKDSRQLGMEADAMGSLQDAVQTLNKALDRLEKAAEQPRGADDGETAQLREAVDGLRRRNETLSAVADQAVLRLDRTIGRVDALLES